VLRQLQHKLTSAIAYTRIPETTYLYCHDGVDVPTVLTDVDCQINIHRSEELNNLVLDCDPALVRSRMERGDRCVTVHLKGRLAHVSWVQTDGEHRIFDAGKRSTVCPGDYWIYHCHTEQYARGHHLYPLVLTIILRQMNSAGFKRAWIYTTKDNVTSQKGIVRAGFKLRQRLLSMVMAGRFVLPLSPSTVANSDPCATASKVR
jgi:hypothetical protein